MQINFLSFKIYKFFTLFLYFYAFLIINFIKNNFLDFPNDTFFKIRNFVFLFLYPLPQPSATFQNSTRRSDPSPFLCPWTPPPPLYYFHNLKISKSLITGVRCTGSENSHLRSVF